MPERANTVNCSGSFCRRSCGYRFYPPAAARNNIFIADDAAHALGTEYKGTRIGQTGTAIFSFHPIKNITTGEGGMFCSDSPDLLEYVRQLKFHGLGVDAYDRFTQGRSPQAQVITPGYKYNLTDIAAALGVKQLDRLEELIKKRTALALRYRERLVNLMKSAPF